MGYKYLVYFNETFSFENSIISVKDGKIFSKKEVKSKRLENLWFEHDNPRTAIWIVEPLEGYNTARAVKGNGNDILDSLKRFTEEMCKLEFETWNFKKLEKVCKQVKHQKEMEEKKRKKELRKQKEEARR